MMHHSSTRILSRKTPVQVLFLLALCLLSCSPGTFAAPAGSPGRVEISLTPLAKTIIFNNTAVLDFGDYNTQATAMAQLFYSELDQTGKYKLLSPPQVNQLLADQTPTDVDPGTVAYALAVGRHLHCRGVITGQLLEKIPLSSEEETESEPDRLLVITMLDTRTTQPVWTVTLSIPPEPAPQEQQLAAETQELIRDSVRQLLQALLKQGAIYSTRVPSPSFLSKKGIIRGSRIILRPAPDYVHAEYQLLRSDSPDGLFRPVGPRVANRGTPLVLEDKGLSDASTYYYTISGITPSGLASIPDPPFAVTTTGPPQPVTSFNATGNGLRQILLSWEMSPDPNVTGYTIYRSTIKDADFIVIAEIDDPDQQSFLDRGGAKSYERFGQLSDNTRYYYTIRSRNKVAVESDPSTTVSALTKGAPLPPTHLKTIGRQPRKVSLSWQAGKDPHTKGYRVFRADSSTGPFTRIAFISGRKTTEYVDEGSFTTQLENDTRYYYKLQAVNVVDITSEDSTVVSAVTKPAPEPVRQKPPTRTKVKEIKLQWLPNREPDIASYDIYKGTTPDSISTKRASVPASQTSYSDRGLEDGVTYWYTIRAIDYDRLKGEFSAPLKGKTKPRPASPTGLEGRSTPQGIELRWKPNREKDIVTYTVFSVGFLNKEITRVAKNHLVVTQGIEPGKEYRFLVTAIDSDGLESEGSEVVTVKMAE